VRARRRSGLKRPTVRVTPGGFERTAAAPFSVAMSNSRLTLALAAAIVAGPLPAGAVDLPVAALSLVDTASVQRRLELQTTSSVSYAESPEQHEKSLRAAIELELGLFDGVQVGVGVPFERHAADSESVSGLGSVELGAAVALVESDRFSMAAGAALELPASDPAIGDESAAGGPSLLADVRLGAAHLALGAGLALRGAGELELTPELGAATYVALGPIIPALEVSATLADEAEVAMAPGVFASLAEGWQLGASGIVGLSDAAPDFGGLLLLSYEIGLGSESADLP
jgi:hypothetical protein